MLLTGCLKVVTGCLLITYRLLTSCLQIAYRLFTGCLEVAYGLLRGCLQVAYRLLTGCLQGSGKKTRLAKSCLTFKSFNCIWQILACLIFLEENKSLKQIWGLNRGVWVTIYIYGILYFYSALTLWGWVSMSESSFFLSLFLLFPHSNIILWIHHIILWIHCQANIILWIQINKILWIKVNIILWIQVNIMYTYIFISSQCQ